MDKKFPMDHKSSQGVFSVESSFFSIPNLDSNHFVLGFDNGVLNDTFFINELEVIVQNSGSCESLDIKISQNAPASLSTSNPMPYELEDLIFIKNKVEIVNGVVVLPINRFFSNSTHLSSPILLPKKELYITVTNNGVFTDFKIKVNCTK